MKTRNKMISKKNIFGKALGDLFACTKEILSRKMLSAVLGVSESAISQWVNGKIFPDAEKLRAIITIYDKQELDDFQKEKYLEFKAVLEHPLHGLWKKAPDSSKCLYASDYVLQNLQEDVENSISVLYYDLKLELYQQFLHQISIIQSELVDKLQENRKSEETLKSKVDDLKQLRHSLQSAKNHTKLTKYSRFVQTVYFSMNNYLKTKLNALDDFEESIDEFSGWSKINTSTDGLIYEGNLICDELGLEMSEIREDRTQIERQWQFKNGMNESPNSLNQAFKRLVKISSDDNNLVSITFGSPLFENHELFSVKIQKGCPVYLSSGFDLNWPDTNRSRPYGWHSIFFHRQILPVDKCNYSRQNLERNTSHLTYISRENSEDQLNSWKKPAGLDNFRRQFIDVKDSVMLIKAFQEFRHSDFLIKSDLTNHEYSVRVLDLSQDEKAALYLHHGAFIVIMDKRLSQYNREAHDLDCFHILSYENRAKNMSEYHKCCLDVDLESSVALVIQKLK